jgi:hypothetical protein
LYSVLAENRISPAVIAHLSPGKVPRVSSN